MMVIQIEKPANITLAAWFAELRSWFDENNCQLAFFASAGRVIDKYIFNVTFAENTQAHLFASKFTKYAPSIRRITSLEPKSGTWRVALSGRIGGLSRDGNRSERVDRSPYG